MRREVHEVHNCLRAVFVVVLVLMSLAGVGGGAVSAASGSGAISGKVYIEGTDTELHNATVTVFNSQWRWVGMDRTGSGGYSVGGLGTGNYYVKVTAVGYYSEYYDNASTQGGATLVAVTDGGTTPDKDFWLTPGKSIKGTVYDNATNPIGHAYVEVVDNQTLYPLDAAYTTDNGSYSIAVAPGTYKVRASAEGRATQYYDNVAAAAAAAPVTLTEAADVTAIDFHLDVSASIAGQVLQADNVTPLIGATVTAYSGDGSLSGSGQSSSDNGTYFINLLPGAYRIVAVAPGHVAQWWDGHSIASEPALPADALPFWTAGEWVTVVAENQTGGCNFAMLPIQAVATGTPGSVTASGSTLNGNLTSMGGSTSINVSFQWGTDTSYAGGTTPATAATAIGPFSADLTGLAPGTLYHFRAVAVGGVTTYGDDITFTTSTVGVPVVTTDAESDVATTSATLNGSLTDLGTGDNVTVSFQYGATASFGSFTPGQLKTATGAFSAPLADLSPDTSYYFRAVAVGDGGTVYGADRSFTTLGEAPAVTTDNATAVGTASATLKGTLDSLGTEASINVSFEWRIADGIWAETTAQTLTAAEAFAADLTGLTQGTTYQFRAKADGYGPPVFGQENSFTTTAVDVEGPVISSLKSSDETASLAIIKWTTNEAATSQVEYGLTDEYGKTTEESTSLVTSHSVELTGLEAGKTYHYRAISKDAAGNETISGDMTLETAASGGGVAAWVWVVIALAAVVGLGGVALLLMKGKGSAPAS